MPKRETHTGTRSLKLIIQLSEQVHDIFSNVPMIATLTTLNAENSECVSEGETTDQL